MEPNAQPPRIQVALATGKLVLPEQGCLGQGGCEAKPDYEGVEPNGQPPRIQVALATGKLVLPEQGCLGQGGCEAKPDLDKVWKRAVMSPYY